MSLIRRRLFHVKNDSFQVINDNSQVFREVFIQYGIELADNLNQSTFHYNLQICLSI